MARGRAREPLDSKDTNAAPITAPYSARARNGDPGRPR